VGEAHRRGLQLHVWFNPFRAATPDRRGAAGARALERTHPDWLVPYGSQTWIDPGIPAARRWVLDAVGDVVARYDVDGVHLDDYFYPYRESRTRVSYVGRRKKRRRVVTTEEIAFADGASWRRYGPRRRLGGPRRLAARQRRRARPRAVPRDEGAQAVGARRRQPVRHLAAERRAGRHGLDAYREIYADARRWWRAGWVDYLAPQLYWTLAGEQRRFLRLDAWWRQENQQQRHLWPGLFTARVSARRRLGRAGDRGAGAAAARGARRQRRVPRPRALPSRRAAPAARWPRRPARGRGLRRRGAPAGEPLAGRDAARGAGAVTCDAAGVRVAPGDTVSVRWWFTQWRAWNGEWRQQLRPASDSTPLPVTFADGSPATHLAVRAVSASGVLGAPLVLRIEPDTASRTAR
jgi:hypothetical protein